MSNTVTPEEKHATERRACGPSGALRPLGDPISSGKAKMPSFCNLSFTAVHGHWLRLGDFNVSKERNVDNFLNEQNNVALISALMLTVQMALLFVLQADYPWEDAAQYMGVAEADVQAVADTLNDFYFALVLFSITFTACAMVLATLQLLVHGELDGRQEFELYQEMMGPKIHGGFKLFFVGMLSFAFALGSLVFFFCRSWEGKFAALAACGVPVAYISTVHLTPSIYTLYRTKHARMVLPQEHQGPIVLSKEQVGEHLDRLVELLDPELISLKVLVQFVQEEHQQKVGIEASLAHMTYIRCAYAVDQFISDRLAKEGIGRDRVEALAEAARDAQS